MLEQFHFAFGITGPVLLLLILGWAIRQLGWVDNHFVTQANALVFNIAMPVILFFALSSQPLNVSLDLPLILVGLGGTLLLVGILLLVGQLVPKDQRGVFVQGSYRGNLAVLGIALAVATYGESVLPLIGMYIAVVTTVYNLVAIWLLDASDVGRRILKNPILIGILAGILASAIDLDIPGLFTNTGRYISGLTLPLALICIGATIELKSVFGHGRSIGLAVFFKLIFSPALLVGLGIGFDLGPMQLSILYFMAASPTATASYIMARQMTQHGALAAEIVAATTTLGVITYTIGIAILKSLGLV
jgi:predicted permease